MRARFAFCFVVALASAGCAETAAVVPLTQVPPDQCPAGWPVDSSAPQAGRGLIDFKSEMSDAFGLQGVLLGLDDLLLCWKAMPSDPGATYLDANRIPAISLPLLEGDHTLSVLVRLQGKESGGVHLGGYRFEVRSSHVFHVERGKLTELTPIAYEKGGPAKPPEEWPALRYVEREGLPIASPRASGAAAQAP
jgi:hypothetical protein